MSFSFGIMGNNSIKSWDYCNSSGLREKLDYSATSRLCVQAVPESSHDSAFSQCFISEGGCSHWLFYQGRWRKADIMLFKPRAKRQKQGTLTCQNTHKPHLNEFKSWMNEWIQNSFMNSHFLNHKSACTCLCTGFVLTALLHSGHKACERNLWGQLDHWRRRRRSHRHWSSRTQRGGQSGRETEQWRWWTGEKDDDDR